MDLKPADPRVLLKMLEGRVDIVTPMALERENFYRAQECPTCGGSSLIRKADAKSIFRANDPMPRYLLCCRDCDCLLDPHSGILLSMGNAAKAMEPMYPILKGPKD